MWIHRECRLAAETPTFQSKRPALRGAGSGEKVGCIWCVICQGSTEETRAEGLNRSVPLLCAAGGDWLATVTPIGAPKVDLKHTTI